MNKVAIVYFSGTGNTKYVADKMKSVIVRKGIEVDLINIEKDKIDPKLYNKIIIGGPVYVERYPEILLRYLKENLSEYKGECMLYSTQASEGQTPVFQHAMKRIKKVKVSYFDYIPMPNNFYNFMFKHCSKEKEVQLIKEASEKAEKAALEFCEGKTKSYDMPNNRVFLADFAYKLTYPFLRDFLLRKLKVDESKCINCGLCVRSCPAKSIKIQPKLKINNKCTFCQRCIHSCPKNAFVYKDKPIIQYKPDRGEGK